MSTTTIATITRMLESLPDPVQERAVEHLREYLLDVEDERKWDALFERTQPQLVVAARKARREIAQGLSEPMDLDQL